MKVVSDMKYSECLWKIAKEIEYDDPHFEFVIGLLSFCFAQGGLSIKQCKIADKFIKNYSYLFNEEKTNA